MSNLAEMYGEFHSVYRGVGKLNGSGCEFEIGQKPDGAIRLFCSSADILPRKNEKDEIEHIELEGVVNSSPISANGRAIRTLYSPPSESDATVSIHHYYFTSAGKFEINVGECAWEEAHTVRFAIANFGGLYTKVDMPFFGREPGIYHSMPSITDNRTLDFILLI